MFVLADIVLCMFTFVTVCTWQAIIQASVADIELHVIVLDEALFFWRK